MFPLSEHDYIPVVILTRSSITESIHYGAIAVVEAGGQLLASYGNPDNVTFLRSTAKPLQAISLVEDGGTVSKNEQHPR